MIERSARDSYNIYQKSEADQFGGWSTLRSIALREILQILSARRVSDGNKIKFESKLTNRRQNLLVESVNAGEIFSTQEGLQLILAEGEHLEHNALNEQIAQDTPRLSGEAITITGEKFFLIDAFISRFKTLDLPPKFASERNKILNFLLDKGYIPVDSEFRIVPFDKK